MIHRSEAQRPFADAKACRRLETELKSGPICWKWRISWAPADPGCRAGEPNRFYPQPGHHAQKRLVLAQLGVDKQTYVALMS